jgi:hypothetical protein
LTIFHNHLFLSFRISCQNKDYEEDGGFPMLAIPSDLQTKFEEHLRNKTIQNSLHGVYKKWLQYYLDFCRKYHFPPIHKESPTLSLNYRKGSKQRRNKNYRLLLKRLYEMRILKNHDFRKEVSYSSLAVLRYLMGYFISKKEMGDENLACPPVFC